MEVSLSIYIYMWVSAHTHTESRLQIAFQISTLFSATNFYK